MENCTIYSHKLAFDTVTDIISKHLPKATIDIQDQGTHKGVHVLVKGGFLRKNYELTINYRERESPSYTLEESPCALCQNLLGMVNFVGQIPLENRTLATQLRYKVMSVNSEIAYMAKPKLNEDFKVILQKIVSELDAIVFAQPSPSFNKSRQQHFLNPDLELLTDTAGRSAIDSLSVSIDTKYFDQASDTFTEEQIKRRHESERLLLDKGIKINWHLPCTPVATDTNLRSRAAVIDRIYALLATAANGEGVERKHLEKLIQEKQITGFTPAEQELLDKEVLSDKEKVISTWRYESLNLLLWAVNQLENLPHPSTICDVPKIVGLLVNQSRAEFEEKAILRDKTEILTALDHIYRMNWACVDARIKQEQVGGELDPSIVYERHYALNWLTQYGGDDWDNVQTDT